VIQKGWYFTKDGRKIKVTGGNGEEFWGWVGKKGGRYIKEGVEARWGREGNCLLDVDNGIYDCVNIRYVFKKLGISAEEFYILKKYNEEHKLLPEVVFEDKRQLVYGKDAIDKIDLVKVKETLEDYQLDGLATVGIMFGRGKSKIKLTNEGIENNPVVVFERILSGVGVYAK